MTEISNGGDVIGVIMAHMLGAVSIENSRSKYDHLVLHGWSMVHGHGYLLSHHFSLALLITESHSVGKEEIDLHKDLFPDVSTET